MPTLSNDEFENYGAPAAPAAAPQLLSHDEFENAKPSAAPEPSSWLNQAKEGAKGVGRGLLSAAGDVGEAVMGPFGPRKDFANLMADIGLGNRPQVDPTYGQQLAKATGLESDKPGFAGTIGEFMGNPESYLGPGGWLGKATMAGISGAGSEAAGKMTEGSGYEPAARLAGAVLAGQAPRALRPLAGMTVSPERAANAAILRGEGVEPTAGELSGSRALRGAEDELGNAPGAGGAFSAMKERQLRQYTRAVVQRMGVDADNALPETVNQARRNASTRLESAARNMRVRMDAPMGNELADLRADLMREGATPEQINRINQQLENVQNGFVTTTARHNGQPDTIMDGRTYQGLTRHGTPLQRAIDDTDPTVSYYATRIRSALDDAMERTATARGTRPGVGIRRALDDLRTARRQWYNMMVISKAAVGPGEAAPAGLITPQKLRSVLTNSDDRKLQYAAGRGDLAELARAGEAIMAPISSSNTSTRSLLRHIPAAIGAALTQSVHGEPISGALTGAVAPGIAGRAILSRPAQSYLKGQLPGQQSLQAFLARQPAARAALLRSIFASPTPTPASPFDQPVTNPYQP